MIYVVHERGKCFCIGGEIDLCWWSAPDGRSPEVELVQGSQKCAQGLCHRSRWGSPHLTHYGVWEGLADASLTQYPRDKWPSGPVTWQSCREPRVPPTCQGRTAGKEHMGRGGWTTGKVQLGGLVWAEEMGQETWEAVTQPFSPLFSGYHFVGGCVKKSDIIT